ncbi:oxysterol-binding protein-related protein 11-like [Halichondria panicea]|uniref:oxysterol-binding protein-related protein 11-like n=1 Tax=Halichondria panicea TaxID=6063 RepID=UPI00312B386D
MHSGDLVELDESGLSEQEKEKLKIVMDRAKQFDKTTAEMLATPPKGMLFKWTNAFKGWQSRWFSINQQEGVLHYYMSEDRQKQPPRGSLQLWGAMVAPSEEDSQTFTVSGTNGDVYKLRAADSRERQHWVTRMRRQVELCSSKANKEAWTQPSQTLSTAPPDSHISSASAIIPPTRSQRTRIATSIRSRPKAPSRKPREELDPGFPGGDAMAEAFSRLQTYQQNMEMQIDSYATQSGINPLDTNVLLLRASSKAAVSTVRDCLTLLKANYSDPDQISTHSGDVETMRRNSITSSPARMNNLSAHGSTRSLGSKSLTSNP